MSGGAKHLERGEQRRGREDRRIAHGPAGGAGGGPELRQHLEARLRLVAPPAGQARRRVREMPLVHEAAADRAGPGVQILVRAPHGEIDIPVVQRQRQVADGMRHVEPGKRAGVVRGARDARAVECLAGAVLHAGPQHQRELAAELARSSPRCPRCAASLRRRAARVSISVSSGSSLCQASCPRIACRSEENAPASMSTLSRMPTGR